MEWVRGWITQRGILVAVITEWKVTLPPAPTRRTRRRVSVPPLRDVSGVVRGYVMRTVRDDSPAEMFLTGEGMAAWHGPVCPVFVDARKLRAYRFRATFQNVQLRAVPKRRRGRGAT
jgi:hypothetical protein